MRILPHCALLHHFAARVMGPFELERWTGDGQRTTRYSAKSPTSTIRVASSARRGLTWRSAYNANCFLRNRFSAATCARDRTAAEANRVTSPMIRRVVRAAARDRDRLIVAAVVRDQRSASTAGARETLPNRLTDPIPRKFRPRGFFADDRLRRSATSALVRLPR